MSDDHSLFSPSGAHRWLVCPASVAMERMFPDTSSVYADEGTAAHFLAAKCLEYVRSAKEFMGQTIYVSEYQKGGGKAKTRTALSPPKEGKLRLAVLVDRDFAENVDGYVEYVREKRRQGGTFFAVEQKLSLSGVLGVPDQFGTVDAVVVQGQAKRLIVIDLKYGKVPVSPAHNPQLMLYAAGANEAYSLIHGPFAEVTLVVYQPRVGLPQEWSCTVPTLRAFADKAARAAQAIYPLRPPEAYEAVPGREQCRFCRANGQCAAATKRVEEVVEVDFSEIAAVPQAAERAALASDEDLARALQGVGFVENWCRAVRAAAFSRLADGREVPGFKLVRGRAGPRKWADKEALRAHIRKMVDNSNASAGWVFSAREPLSPAQMEKSLGKRKPNAWRAIEAQFVTRAEGALSVAPEDDPREAVRGVSGEMESAFAIGGQED
jgi:hypothetical protein